MNNRWKWDFDRSFTTGTNLHMKMT